MPPTPVVFAFLAPFGLLYWDHDHGMNPRWFSLWCCRSSLGCWLVGGPWRLKMDTVLAQMLFNLHLVDIVIWSYRPVSAIGKSCFHICFEWKWTIGQVWRTELSSVSILCQIRPGEGLKGSVFGPQGCPGRYQIVPKESFEIQPKVPGEAGRVTRWSWGSRDSFWGQTGVQKLSLGAPWTISMKLSINVFRWFLRVRKK